MPMALRKKEIEGGEGSFYRQTEREWGGGGGGAVFSLIALIPNQ